MQKDILPKKIINTSYPIVNLKDLIKLSSGKGLVKKDMVDGEYSVYGGNGINGSHNEYLIEKPTIVIGRVGEYCGAVHITKPKSWITDNGLYITEFYQSVNLKYLSYVLNKLDLNQYAKVGGQPSISQSTVLNLSIPLPPIEVQEEIVKELDQYQKIIDGAKQVVDNYKPVIDIDPNWEMVELGDVCEFKRGPFGGSLKKEIFVKKGYLVYEQYHAINDDMSFGRYFITNEKFDEMKSFSIKTNDLLISCSGTMGKMTIIPDTFRKGIINQALLRLRPIDGLIDVWFLRYYLESNPIQEKYFRNQNGVAIQNVMSVKDLKQIPVPKISIELQRELSKKVLQEIELMNGNQKIIEIYTQKTKDRINKIWGEN